MSTIPDKADSTYIVQQDTLLPASSPDGLDDVSVTPVQIAEATGVWITHQTIDLDAEVSSFEFTDIPADAKFVKIEGLLAAQDTSASAITPSIRLNGVNASVYAFTKYNFTGGGLVPSHAAGVPSVPFSSSWSGKEKVFLEMVVECDNELTIRKAIKSSTYNTGGDGDFHHCGAFADINAVINSIQFFDALAIGGSFGINTKLVMSVMK